MPCRVHADSDEQRTSRDARNIQTSLRKSSWRQFGCGCALTLALRIAAPRAQVTLGVVLCRVFAAGGYARSVFSVPLAREVRLHQQRQKSGHRFRSANAKTCRKQAQQNASLFDHFVGECEQCRRNSEPEALGGGEIDSEDEIGWLLHRNVARFRAAKYFVDVVARSAE
jgi:hypothetical protein